MSDDKRTDGAVVMNGVVEHIERKFAPELEALRKKVERLELDLTPVASMLSNAVNEQAEDEALWFDAITAPEAYLQGHLRDLRHHVEDAVGFIRSLFAGEGGK